MKLSENSNSKICILYYDGHISVLITPYPNISLYSDFLYFIHSLVVLFFWLDVFPQLSFYHLPIWFFSVLFPLTFVIADS